MCINHDKPGDLLIMEYKDLTLLHEIDTEIANNDAVLIYFSAPHCNVCKVLKPKIAELIRKEFPRIQLFYVNIDKAPVVSGQYRIFSIPTVVVCFDGKEHLRKSRNIGLNEIANEIARPYSMMF